LLLKIIMFCFSLPPRIASSGGACQEANQGTKNKEQKNKGTREQKNKEQGALRANKRTGCPSGEQKNRVPFGRTKEQKNRVPYGRTKEQRRPEVLRTAWRAWMNRRSELSVC
jgi:hypothetical protein